MIDTLFHDIDVVRKVDDRISLLKLRDRFCIMAENRRGSLPAVSDRLIPLSPDFSRADCLAAFHAQALQWRGWSEYFHDLLDGNCERVRDLRNRYHVFASRNLRYFLVDIKKTGTGIPAYGITDLSADLKLLQAVSGIARLCGQEEICLAVFGTACLYRSPSSGRYFAVRFGNTNGTFGKCIQEIVLLPETFNDAASFFEQQIKDWEYRFEISNVDIHIPF